MLTQNSCKSQFYKETHDRYRDKVTPKFKKRLNKWQSVKQKIKKKERKKINDGTDVA